MGKIITIGREFGSGGREVGKRLSDELGIAYYDNEIITEIAKRTELAEGYVQHVMENGPTALMPITIGRTFLYGRGSCDGTEQCDLQRTEPVSTGTRGEIRLCDRRKKCRLYPARQKAAAPVYLCRYGIAHGAMQKACTGAGTFYRQRAETSYSGCG